MKKIIPILAISSILSTNAMAETDGGFQIGVGAGALSGGTATIGYRFSGNSYWSNAFAIRAEYNSWKPFESIVEDQDIEIDGTKLAPSLSGDTFGVLLDYYPFASTWFLGNIRLSGGYYFGDIDAKLHHSEKLSSGESYNFEFNHNHYSISAVGNTIVDLDAKLNPDLTGPYVGVGFDLGLFGGFKMFLDAGFVKTDKTDIITNIDINSSSYSITENGTSISDENVIETAMYEAIDDEIKDFRDKEIVPIVKLGFLYRF